jgi:hypothetical protein
MSALCDTALTYLKNATPPVTAITTTNITTDGVANGTTVHNKN